MPLMEEVLPLCSQLPDNKFLQRIVYVSFFNELNAEVVDFTLLRRPIESSIYTLALSSMICVRIIYIEKC